MLFLIGFAACDDSEILTYGEADYIYFEAENEDEGFPQAKFSFVFEADEVSEKNIEIPVLVTGKFAGENRTFSVKVVDSLTTAVEGTHFSIDPNQQIIVDNETGGNVVINLQRTADLKENNLTIGLELVENDRFTPGIQKVIQLNINDYFSKPEWWYFIYVSTDPHIGPFNQTKGILWLEYWEIFDGSDPWSVDPYVGPNETYRYNSDLCWATVNSFRAWLIQKEEDSGELIIDEETGLRVLDTFDYPSYY